MAFVGMNEMRRIFELIDSLGIHREKVEVPLVPTGPGAVRMLSSGKVEIVLPEDLPLEAWIETLKSELEKLPIERAFVDYDESGPKNR